MIKSISVHDLKTKLDAGETIQVIDIREPYEIEVASFGGISIPMGEIMDRKDELASEGMVVIHCQSGQRAAAVCEGLQRLFNKHNVYNLTGGLNAWIEEIDPSLAQA